MKIITINLGEPHIKALAMLKDLGLYPSRSEAIRVAIRDFLKKELGLPEKGARAATMMPDPDEPTSEELIARKKEIERMLRQLKQDRMQAEGLAFA